MDLEPLVSSLGDTSLDSFYFICAYAPVEQIRDRLRQEPSQEHLNLGLKAAFITQRADIAKLLLDQGANVEPLIATIGFEATQAFMSKGQQALKSQHIKSSPLALSSPARSLREQNDLRLQWTQLKPRNSTVSAIVEGVEDQRPTALHLQAHNTRSSSIHRLMWMQFDLVRSANAHLNRIADICNVQGTPLHWTVDDHADVSENREVLAFLLGRGADPTIKNRVNQTPREMCLEQLELPDGTLLPKSCEFYLYAVDELGKAEQNFAAATARSQSTSLFSKAKSVFGWAS